MTHKLLLISAFTLLSVSLSWGDEAGRCPPAGTIENGEDTSRTATIQSSSRHDSALEPLPMVTHNPTGVNENTDRTAAN